MLTRRAERAGELEAIKRTFAMISFTPTGEILDANDVFLSAMEYSLAEVQGQHHRIFMATHEADTAEYRDFWHRLGRGEAMADCFKRVTKSGREVWIEASYMPVLSKKGAVERVVKCATDVTERCNREAEATGKIKAIETSMAVIEFDLDGTILTANENFLQATGYRLDEIKGQHHRMFVDDELARSEEYRDFWHRLRNGGYEAGQFKRVRKDGRELWIEASYNPIFDTAGRPVKVIKFASDVTDSVLTAQEAASKLDAISRSQAVIEFRTDGTILTANENFLSAVGYSLDEIRGKHHRMFVETQEADSAAYAAFWDKLRGGAFEARVYKRVCKDGSPIWIQASYNPIFDSSGRTYKIVKYATDVTDMMRTVDLAEDTSRNVQSVATAVEELSASIQEISQNMARSTEATRAIMDVSVSSNEAAEQLVGTMQSMQSIVDLIESVAGQVNLLALNATIEAARAGDAGRGFAVVASEVKNLASQTSAATEQISGGIENIQTIARSVSDAVKNTLSSASNVESYVSATASAIEEQSVVTRDISDNTARTVNSVQDIAERIRRLSVAA